MRKSICLIFIVFIALIVTGCSAGKTRRVDLDAEIVNDPQATSVQDYRTVADKMARSLLQLSFIHKADTPPTIAFIDVENRSNKYIDTRAFQEKIRTLLLKNCRGKIYFLDRAAIKDILKERKIKRKGQATASAKANGKILGADYFLTGSIHSMTSRQSDASTDYMRYSFRLTDADNSLIVWEDDYESRSHTQKSWQDQ